MRLDMDSKYGSDFSKSRQDRALGMEERRGQVWGKPMAQFDQNRVGMCGRKSGR